VTKEDDTLIAAPETTEETLCYHCGTPCVTSAIAIDDKTFCCDGCKLVYEIINEKRTMRLLYAAIAPWPIKNQIDKER
jgi:Cu+-exporting ATPase